MAFLRTLLSPLSRIIHSADALIIDHTDGPAHYSLVWFVRRQIVRKVHRYTVYRAKGIPLFLYPVCGETKLLLVLEYHQLEVSRLQVLPENYAVYFDALVLLTNCLHLHGFWIQRIPVGLKEGVKRVIQREV